MLEKRDLQILKVLENQEYVSSDVIATHLGCSTRTIRTRIKELNIKIKNQGAHIKIKKGSGYLLTIADTSLFFNYLARCKKYYHSMTGDQIVTQLIQIFTTTKGYVKADTIIEQLFISKSTLTKYLKELKVYLRQYDLDMDVKPHYGLKIIGSEFNYRRFIASKYVQDSISNDEYFKNVLHNDINLETLQNEISIIVKEEMEKHSYTIRQTIFDSLLSHLLITVIRIQQDMPIDREFELFISEDEFQPKDLVKSIIERVSNISGITFPKKEHEYVLMHFGCKRILNQDEVDNIPQKINCLINEILITIYKEQNINLMHNFDLRTMLGLHLVPLLNRLRFGTVLRNPILEEVKKACVAGYSLAIVASKIIEEKMKVCIEDDEISYLALHFDVALNTQNTKYKKRVLIECSTGIASAQLLKYKFKQYFDQYLETIQVCDIQELEKYTSEGEYDYIFTTVPITIKTKIPVFEFQFFLNENSVKRIQSILSGQQNKSISSIFLENLFFNHVHFKDRKEALHYILTEIKKVKILPDDFEELVWERENYSSTDILPNVALPHPNRLSTNETFVATIVLDRPMLWHTQKVNIILLLSISKHDSEKYKYIFDWIIRLFASNSAVQRIIKEKNYDSLKRELLLINEGDIY